MPTGIEFPEGKEQFHELYLLAIVMCKIGLAKYDEAAYFEKVKNSKQDIEQNEAEIESLRFRIQVLRVEGPAVESSNQDRDLAVAVKTDVDALRDADVALAEELSLPVEEDQEGASLLNVQAIQEGDGFEGRRFTDALNDAH